MKIICQDGNDVVAINFGAGFVDEEAAVAVSVVGDAEIEMIFDDGSF